MTEFSERNSKKPIMVLLEKKDGKLTGISLEVLTGAYKLSAAAGCKVYTAVLGHNFEEYDPKAFAEEAACLAEKIEPALILTGATASCMGMTAMLAKRLDTGLVSDCIDIEYSEDNGFCPVRPDASGSVRQVMSGIKPPIVSVRPGTFEAELDGENILEQTCLLGIKKSDPDNEKAVELMKTVLERKHSADISKARILVSGGRGVGGPEGFSQLRKLADLLGGEVACSRACIEAGWADPSMQVGQTGKTVHPELYVACGISGAIQHVTGMKDAGLIIAINKNPAAPIFDVADLGIVGNLENILPALIKTLQEKKGDANAI